MTFLSMALDSALPGLMKLAAADTPPAAALATLITVSLAIAASVRLRGGGVSARTPPKLSVLTGRPPN
jgi:hypothetical protein